MDIKPSFDLLSQYKLDVLSSLLPNIINASEGFFSSNGIFKIDVCHDFTAFDNSCFDANLVDDSRLIHFTTTTNCLSILESNELWFSSLNKLFDSRELIHANQYFGDNSLEVISKLKSRIFSLSSCLYDSDTINNDLMWNEYAVNNTGIALILKLKQTGHLYSCFIGRIKYSDHPIVELQEILSKHAIFQLEHPNICIVDLNETFHFLSAFYKEKKWEHEKEIRLLSIKQPYEIEDYDLKNLNRDFFKLRLSEQDSFAYSIEIESIKFGSSISPTDKDRVHSLMRERNIPLWDNSAL